MTHAHQPNARLVSAVLGVAAMRAAATVERVFRLLPVGIRTATGGAMVAGLAATRPGLVR